ncbi:MAG: tetratricopeptide repeat protein [Gemmatimonadetes bacterium]|nr:tetratricopeptide repeat protein [Gemmatimonadota bacterium]MCC6770479.1 tetratricopeptide repeat protein [Gemmatimonadaceae bacterium]
MASDAQRAARAAFDAARSSFGRLTSGGDPHDVAAALVEAWGATEHALCALAGTGVLSGVAVVRELRQRSLLGLDDAHAFVDFHAAAERAREPGYSPTTADLDSARTGEERMDRVLARDLGATDPQAAPYSGPISPPRTPVHAADAATAPPLHIPTPARNNRLAVLVVAVACLAVVAASVYYLRLFSGEPDALRTGRAAFAAGDRLTARNAFSAAAGANPSLAEPHIYLGRIAREDGNLPAASAELRRAVELEPDNFLAHRELAAYLLVTGQPDLARSFYQRAIELNPSDKVALGYMACALLRLGRPDLADRFFQRAGPGDWLACQSAPLVAPSGAQSLPAAPPR